jgi:putative ABC transport system permease protein
MGIPILKGREFTPRDTVSAPGVIVINEAMARAFWPKDEPVGKAIRLGGSDGPRLTIVGVAGDVHFLGLDTPVRQQFFRPYTQAGWPIMNVVVRTIHAPATFAVPVKKAIANVLPDWPVSGFQIMEDVVHDSTGSRRFPMLLLSVFSVVALLLAAVGILGVVGHSVAQRTREIGLRMALGARQSDVEWQVMRETMALVAAGAVAGVGGALPASRVAVSLLYGVSAADPVAISGALAVLGATAFLAGWIPARRASRVDPMTALRQE